MRWNIKHYESKYFSGVVTLATDILWMERPKAEEVAKWLSETDQAQGFVAEVEGEVAGFLTLEWGKFGWAGVAIIGLVAVAQDHRRRGIGTALIHAAEALAREKGFRKIYIETGKEDHAAQSFYAENGYAQEAVLKNFLKDGEDSLIYGKHL